jgi:hypothetical protein
VAGDSAGYQNLGGVVKSLAEQMQDYIDTTAANPGPWEPAELKWFLLGMKSMRGLVVGASHMLEEWES